MIGSQQRPPKTYEKEHLEYVPPYSLAHSHIHDEVCYCSAGHRIRARHLALDNLAQRAAAARYCEPPLILGGPALTQDNPEADPSVGIPITIDDPSPTPPSFSPTERQDPTPTPNYLGPEWTAQLLADRYPSGIPQSTHSTEYSYYFEKLIDNTGSPDDPRYWRELDRQVRTQFPNPDPAVEKRVSAIAHLKKATSRCQQNRRQNRPRPYPLFEKVASNPEVRRSTPVKTRRKRKQRREVVRRQIQEDLSELDTDPFRQGTLDQYNSADALINPNCLEELARRYPEWYKN